MVQQAQRAHAPPSDCTQGLLFVYKQHASVFCSGNMTLTSPPTQGFIGHWPTMAGDTREYVSACFICAHGKTSHCPPSGVLCPLPIPHRPWSHIAVDFVTGLPPSEDNTVILTIVNQFSKLFHFVSLPKLPTVFEAASLLVVHVFRLQGIPTDIAGKSGLGVCPSLCDLSPSGLLVLSSPLDRVRPQLSGQLCCRYVAIYG